MAASTDTCARSANCSCVSPLACRRAASCRPITGASDPRVTLRPYRPHGGSRKQRNVVYAALAYLNGLWRPVPAMPSGPFIDAADCEFMESRNQH